MGSKVIGFRVPEDLAVEVEAKAAELGQTTGEFLRKLVDDALYPAKSIFSLGGKPDSPADQLAAVSERLSSLAGEVGQLRATQASLGEQQGDYATAGQLAELSEQHESLRAITQKMAEINDENVGIGKRKWGKLQLCPDCGSSLHLHRLDSGNWHLECVLCGYYSPDHKPIKWKDKPGEHPISVKVAPANQVPEAKAKVPIVYEDPHDPEYKAIPSLGCWVLQTTSAPVADKS